MTLGPMILQIASWAAYLSAAGTVLTLLTGILFFTLGEAFGKFNDLSSVFQMILMIPLPPGLGDRRGVGLAGILLSALGQILLVLGRIDFQASRKFFPAGGAVGLWLILVCLIGAGSGQLGGLALWPGLLAGAGYLATVGGFLLRRAGPSHLPLGRRAAGHQLSHLGRGPGNIPYIRPTLTFHTTYQ